MQEFVVPLVTCGTCNATTPEDEATEIGLGTGAYVCEYCWINN